ncbi:hypothetical protein SAMN05421743_101412 [Thalassobacillus cyri]|uniref:Uncharacterized protein n=1 Tax=Thalassobacillus cyri TaxID=571932 RepID=A0A1H3WES6_9BACI|nr:hypothetical protein SAMN05421743_101412 [Thalassobacillus cyri]
MIWLYMVSPLLLFLVIRVYIDMKNMKHNNVEEKIDCNEYKYKAYQEVDRYQDIN